ncbi:MAG: outer membrane beta-barrel protein [Candidatus Marinimicrobia bacterium]|nr:outer membrane beta-barrel protein [Candidatus Neomarinimicrobiota bacterium]
MKIILLNILFFSAIFAQSGLIIMGGLNQSKQNIEEDAEGLEINYMNGYNLYVERSFGVARFGVGLNQRGVKLNQAVSDMGVTVSADGEQTLNYLTVHAIYLYEIQEIITVFGGIQLGNGIGGEAKVKHVISGSGYLDGTSVETEDIDAEDMDLEYGLFLGADYMINEKIGIRASYFKGLSDIVEDAKTKNNTLSVSLLYHLK